MKKFSKVIASLLMILLVGSGFSMQAKAASGQLLFSDPETSVGEIVEVKVKITSYDNVGDVELNLKYDPEFLRLNVEEDSIVSGEDGSIHIKTSEPVAGTEFEQMLNFYALQEGTTTVDVEGMTVTDAYGENMDMTEGNSSITIAAGDPSKIPSEEEEIVTPEVHLDGVVYHVAQFSDVEIPDGFVRSSLSYEGQDCDCIKLEKSDMHAFFLRKDGEETSAIFLYDGDTGIFTPFHVLSVAADNYIILLRDDNHEISIGDPFQETSITIGEDTFPAWQNPEDGDFYLVYALNVNGKKSIYRYDAVEKTYQRYTVVTDHVEVTESVVAETALDQFVDTYWRVFAIAGSALILFLLILLLVVRIKLARRDRELDDLYDEYGIDLPEEELTAEQKKAQARKKHPEETEKKPEAAKAKKTQENKIVPEVEDDSEDFEEYDEDELTEEDFETSEIALPSKTEPVKVPVKEHKVVEKKPDAQTPDVRVPASTTNLFDEEEDEFDLEEEIFDDDSEIEDLDQLLDIKPERKRGHIDEDDTFKVDFIDLG